jgi:alpha-L-fucosidase
MIYEADWRSLSQHPTPQWFKDAKFGIYTHWGVYSVPAYGPNGTWYPYNMYREGTAQYEHHVKTYGDPAQFGYKDFIPMFTGEKFDPDAWAALFAQSGAQFAGPVGEHHDGFCMWDTTHSEWNATKLGPKRDVVGELERAIRAQGMRYMVALHHAENWWFFPHWKPQYDTADPRYASLYGAPHNLTTPIGEGFFDQEKPDQAFLERWQAKILEVIDKYRPDMLWFDFGLKAIQEKYKKAFLSYYYNKEAEWGKEVVLTYKWHDLVAGTAVLDLERGRLGELAYYTWINDTTVDAGDGWGYIQNTDYKSTTTLIHGLVDIVSKNGCLLLNVGPKPNGEIPDEAKERLLGIGEWLKLNGEAIYGTMPWMTYGEGPTRMVKSGYFSEDQEVRYTANDIRFTGKGSSIYAILLGWTNEPITIESLKALYNGEVRAVSMLGSHEEIRWEMTDAGLLVHLPAQPPCEHAYVLKIERNEW